MKFRSFAIVGLLTPAALSEEGTGKFSDKRNVPIQNGEFVKQVEPRDNQRNTSAIGPIRRSPCSGSFSPPIYELDVVSAAGSSLGRKLGIEGLNGTLHVNFTVRDVANEVAFQCNWNVLKESPNSYDVDETCVSEDGFHSDFGSQTPLWVQAFSLYEEKPGPISIVQFWFCEREDGSYPLLYQAAADFDIDLTCANLERDPEEPICNVTTTLPVTVKANWTLPEIPASKQLLPNPMGHPAVSKGLDPPPTTDCTDLSFTYPEYALDNVRYGVGGKNAVLNFTLASRATGLTATCAGHVSDTEGSANLSCVGLDSNAFSNDSKLAVSYDPSRKAVDISHQWVCGDTDGKFSTQFVATASVTLPPNGCTTNNEQPSCQKRSVTVMGTLEKPVALKPDTYLPLPPKADVAGCTAKSSAPTWQITKLRFDHTTERFHSPEDPPDESPNDIFLKKEPWSRPSEMLELGIMNAANGYKTFCTFISRYDGPVSNVWWRCNLPDHDINERYSIDTYIYLNSTDGHLAVNQTWYCDNEDGESASRFTATAYAPMDCGWTNTTDTRGCESSGEYDASRCAGYNFVHWCRANSSSTATIEGQLTRQDRLTIKNLTSPDPIQTNWSCTVASLGRPITWVIQSPGPTDFNAEEQVATDWGESFDPYSLRTDLIFYLNTSALGAPPSENPAQGPVLMVAWGELTPYMPDFDPTKWHELLSPFGNTLDLRLRYNASASYMEIEHSWYCDDKNWYHPFIFEGKWSGYVPLNCHMPPFAPSKIRLISTFAMIKCTFAGGGVEVMPTVTYHTSTTPIVRD